MFQEKFEIIKTEKRFIVPMEEAKSFPQGLPPYIPFVLPEKYDDDVGHREGEVGVLKVRVNEDDVILMQFQLEKYQCAFQLLHNEDGRSLANLLIKAFLRQLLSSKLLELFANSSESFIEWKLKDLNVLHNKLVNELNDREWPNEYEIENDGRFGQPNADQTLTSWNEDGALSSSSRKNVTMISLYEDYMQFYRQSIMTDKEYYFRNKKYHINRNDNKKDGSKHVGGNINDVTIDERDDGFDSAMGRQE
ncbi:hypothetical protein HELRODRAFT_172562 [Helobdella robusta]|uniref:Uncharacterized protein n=1 Tax=Helobdella robusta TaxID=6412 RepID=T1F5I7_HELRO|nr:hypothetical protein HELRODRAFT_172562 [Helobdella robusta]ESO04212.1 hypothetical protein HELRODRAFT_172562 [Helobdella robusta]